MNNALLHAHSGLRWLVLIMLVTSIVLGFINSSKNKPFKKGLYAGTMGILHVQIIIGIIVWIIKYNPLPAPMAEIMKDAAARKLVVEHPIMMLLAAIIATIGFSLGKRAKTPAQGHKQIAIMYALALILILVAIPWDASRLF